MRYRLGGRELLTILKDDVSAHKEARRDEKLLKLALAVIIFLVVIIGGLVALVTYLFKDSFVREDNTLTSSSGRVLHIAENLESLPLAAAPALSSLALQRAKTLTIRLPWLTPSYVTVTHSVATVYEINDTAVIFNLVQPGAQVRVINGVARYVPGTGQAALPLCAADISCSSLMADSGMIDFLKAKAAASLRAGGYAVPIGLLPPGAKRRLSEAPEVSSGSDERGWFWRWHFRNISLWI